MLVDFVPLFTPQLDYELQMLALNKTFFSLGKMISLAERIRTQSSRRTAAEAAKKFAMLDSDSEDSEESEKEVFTVIDHGQGNKELDLTPIKPPPIQKSQQQSEEKLDANAGPSSSL